MSVMFNVIFVSRCSSTHHKLAMDALRHVRGDDADRWRDLFLKHHPSYLEGSKAPDDRFKDFKNHVLHVGEGEWGGAIKAVQTWYDRFVNSLREQDWEEAVFAAGVLSHYYTDPLQPFHTGQTEAEGKVHRAAEWSICKCYHEFQQIIEQDFGGYPALELPTTPDWLADHVRNGAHAAHRSYDLCIEHYDLAKGVRNPPAGLDQEMKDAIAELIGLATVGFARLLERGFDESQVQPPAVELMLDAIIAQCRRPVNWIVRQLKDLHERNLVMDIYREAQNTGKVIESLPMDDRAIRRLHAQEVRQIPLGELDAEQPKVTGSAHGTGEPPRSRPREPVTRLARGSRFRFTRGQRPTAVPQAAPQPQSIPSQPLPVGRVDTVRNETLPPDQDVRREVIAQSAPVATPLGGTYLAAGPFISDVTPVRPDHSQPASGAMPPVNRPLLSERDKNRDAFDRLRESAERRTVYEGIGPASPSIAPAQPTPSATSAFLQPVVEQVAEDRSIVGNTWSAARPVADNRPREQMLPTTDWQQQRAERDRIERDRQDQDRQERERLERERLQRDRMERDQAERDRMERDRAERLRADQARMDQERQERERSDRERYERDLARQRDELARTDIENTTMPLASSRTSRSGRFFLETTSDVEQAPSIGGKTADRLRSVGLRTVRQLLDAAPEKTAARINQRWITAEVIRQWQQQATLVCRIPELRGHDAQILVGCGITDPDDLATRSPDQLKSAVDAFCATTAGERILRGSEPPDAAELREWIAAASQARGLAA